VGANTLAISKIELINATDLGELTTTNSAIIICSQSTGHLICDSNDSTTGFGSTGSVFATLGSAIQATTAFAASNFTVVA
jgi:hypothetical protein